jgi:hypothetical protein
MSKLPEYPRFPTRTLELRQYIATLITIVSSIYKQKAHKEVRVIAYAGYRGSN